MSFESSSTEIPPLQNPAIPLDYSLLSSFVTTLLYCELDQCPTLPEFRIKEILSVCGYKSEQRNKTDAHREKKVFPNEFRLTFVTLAFHTLCCYFSLSTVYPPELMGGILFILETFLSESLLFENHLGQDKKLEMQSLPVAFRPVDTIDTKYKLEIFVEGIEIVREILREALTVAKVMNKAKDLVKLEERKQAIPKVIDSYQAYCFYTSSSFALFHIGLTLHRSRNLGLATGFVESLILCMITLPSPTLPSNSQSISSIRGKGGSNIQPSKSSKDGIATDKSTAPKESPPSMTRCVAYIQRLAVFVAHVVFDESYLRMMKLAKHRISKHFNNPTISYVKLRTNNFRTILGVPENTHSTSSSGTSDLMSKSLKICPDCPGFYITDHIALDVSLIDPNDDDSFLSPAKKSQKQGYAASTLIWNDQSVDPQKNDHYWSLKKSFRTLFLVFDSVRMRLRDGPRFFLPNLLNDTPPVAPSLPSCRDLSRCRVFQKLSFSKATQLIETLYCYHCSQGLLPKVLNPCSELFWICTYCIEYLFQQSQVGEGFNPSLEQEKRFLSKQIKLVESKTEQREYSVTFPALPLSRPPVENRKVSRRIHTGAQSTSLEVLLSRAKKEAALESKLINVDKKIKDRALFPSRFPNTSSPNLNSPTLFETPKPDNSKEDSLLLDSLIRARGAQIGLHDEELERRLGAETDVDRGMLDQISSDSEGSLLEQTDRVENSRQVQFTMEHERPIPSPVWTCPPKPTTFGERQSHLLLKGGNVESSSFESDNGDDDNPLKNLPSQQDAIEYGRSVQSHKQKEERQSQAFRQYLADLQESIVQKNKLNKQFQLNKLKEKFKEDQQAQQLYQQQLAAQKEKVAVQQRLRKEREEEALNQAKELEKLKIYEIKAMKVHYEEQKQMEQQQHLEYQKYQIAKLRDRQEQEEIIRRELEEQRMRYLEKRQQLREQRLLMKQEELRLQEEQKRLELQQQIQLSQARVRRGQFRWINGKYQYYDSVRHDALPTPSTEEKDAPKQKKRGAAKPEELPNPLHSKLMYIQYDDEYGQPYYYDPILQLYQRRMPEDAEIVHYIDYEREQYDSVYGTGSYDAYQEEIAWKKEANKNGGWYDENGKWIVARGYFDENNFYEWVDLDGYYDEHGQYIKYPKVQGDLSFMV